MRLSSYSEMTDAEIDSIIDFKVKIAKMEQETLLKTESTIMETNELIELARANCEQSREALQYMCGQILKPQGLTITAIEFRPMEFGNE